ncbi:long-chain-fatty-acid--CoA ligase [Virgibacillus dakarensis]|nr:long-chain-fatty-acid--CoA ligase [Virgibacillus dakarensis]
MFVLIGDIPRRNSKLYPDKVAIIDGDVQMTYFYFNQRINSLANAVLSSGLRKGNRIAVLFKNGFQYLELYFAAAKAGTPIVPINFRVAEQELLEILLDSDPEILFFGEEFYPLVLNIKHKAVKIKQYICIEKSIQSTASYEDFIRNSPTTEPNILVNEDDIAILGYTGGTTGLPKGVMTTHRNVVTNCFQTALDMKFHSGHRFLCVSPLFHAGGSTGFLRFSLVGGSNVIVNSSNPTQILRYIEEYNVTHTLLVPALILRFLQMPEIHDYNLSSLECIMYGTAPMPLEPLKKALNTFNCDFAQVYGSTETFTAISLLLQSDHVRNGSEKEIERMKSAGRQVCGVEIKISDEHGKEVQVNETGEILVKGKNVMKGYWRRPELTSNVLRDGWYHTGDIGKMDELGYVYIVDRKKDMIISGGENIYPREVENVLFTHPAVTDCAVIGIPDESWGESVKALVVLKEGIDLTKGDLINYCKKHLASYKKPRSIEFVSTLNRTATGKIQKNKIRDQYWKGNPNKV